MEDGQSNSYEYKTVAVAKSTPLKEQIVEVSREISEWLQSFGRQSDNVKQTLRLTRVEETADECRYQYSIKTNSKLSAARKKLLIYF